jgi:hypothetical protein
MERKTGTVYSSNPKGWIFVYVSPQERYFGHVSQIKADHMPVLGEKISFEVGASRKPGQLPLALDIQIVGGVS